MTEKTIEVKNNAGLDPRIAALFVQAASKYKSKIWIEKEEKQINAKSIMGVMSLGITKGASIKICAEGSDENESLVELVSLVQ